MRPSRPPAPPPAPKGETAFGAYTLRERIAVGGMAEVFLALEPRAAGESRTVVVKRMLPHIAAEPHADRMFAEEARLGSLVEHPNVVRVLGSDSVESKPFLVLEHVPGTDLAAMQASLRAAGRRLPAPLAIFIASELLAGLHAVHEATERDGTALGIVHGDVTPSNVLVSVHGDVKLGDFGIAEARLRETFPQAAASGRTRGKLGYLAPEQVRGEPADRRVDVFAAAVVTAELLIGQPLFTRGSELAILLAVREAKLDRLHEHQDALPQGLLEVLHAALARHPEERLGTAAELRMRLAPFLNAPPAKLRDELGRVATSVSGTARIEGDEPPTADVITMEPPLDDYIVVRTNGRELGPLTFAQLVEAVTMGRVGVEDRVRLGNGPARALKDIGELAGHVPASSERPHTDRVPMGSEFVDAVARRAIARADGVFICRRGAVRKDVYLLDGVPEFVSSNIASELLGEFLVEQGIILREELDMALAVLPRFDGRLGDTLAALGLVEPVELFRHIAAQVREKLLDLFTWQEGFAHFQADVRPTDRFFPLGLDPWRVLGDGIQRRLEAGLEQDVFVEHMIDDLVQTGAPPPDGLPEEVVYVLHLTRDARPMQEVVDRLDAPGDLHRPYRAIRMALALDLVRFA